MFSSLMKTIQIRVNTKKVMRQDSSIEGEHLHSGSYSVLDARCNFFLAADTPRSALNILCYVRVKRKETMCLWIFWRHPISAFVSKIYMK